MENENVKFLGQSSTIMRSLRSKDGDFFPRFDDINERNTATDFNNTFF